MIRTRASLLAVLLLGLVGCSVGGDDGGMMMPSPVDAAEPDVAAELKSLCTAKLTVTGTFTAAGTLDPLGGCQPQGTWAVTATVSDKGTCANVPLKPDYSYTMSGTGRDAKITYSKASNEEFVGAVTANGGGGCEGSFLHVQPDSGNFDQVQLHGFLPKVPAADLTELPITGTGEFNLWMQHP
jgi:hypothetical protein